jgi:hypothetical protein
MYAKKNCIANDMVVLTIKDMGETASFTPSFYHIEDGGYYSQ